MSKASSSRRSVGQNRTKPGNAQSGPPNDQSMSAEDQKDLILGILFSFLEDEETANLEDYIRHVGFDLGAINKSQEMAAAWLGYYHLRQGAYDVDRACNDLATWPPIAGRIFELQREERARGRV
jgi:hypothetical protein